MDLQKNSKGEPVFTLSEQACSFCLMGAFIKCYTHREIEKDQEVTKHWKNVRTYIMNTFGRSMSNWNDNVAKSKEEVIQLLEKFGE